MLGVAIAVATSALLAAPASSLAGTVTVTGGNARGVLTYAGAPGEANRLSITEQARTYIVRDPAGVTPAGRCSRPDATDTTLASCPRPRDVTAAITLGDGDDEVLDAPDDPDFEPYDETGAVMNGGDGNDTLRSGGLDWQLSGGPGDDVLIGAGGRDILIGGDGNDRLAGGWASDALDGENGDDRLMGGPGDDALLGRAGADELDGGRGRDALIGDRGDDVFRSRDRQYDSLFCAGGHDHAFVDRDDMVRTACEDVVRRGVARPVLGATGLESLDVEVEGEPYARFFLHFAHGLGLHGPNDIGTTVGCPVDIGRRVCTGVVEVRHRRRLVGRSRFRVPRGLNRGLNVLLPDPLVDELYEGMSGIRLRVVAVSRDARGRRSGSTLIYGF